MTVAELDAPPIRTGRATAWKLGGMMFAFYFALGAWSVSFPTYQMTAPPQGLGLTARQVSGVASAFAVASLVAPLLIGVLADRYFRAERVLACACLMAAVMLFAVARFCDSEQARAAQQLTWRTEAAELARGVRFLTLAALMLGLQLFVQLGLTLTSVVALRNLADRVQFSRVRLWGTLGWVAAGNAVGLLLVGVSTQPLDLGAAAFLALGAAAVMLPRTPPLASGAGARPAERFGLAALGMLKKPAFAVFLAVTFASVALNQFYNLYAHRYLTELQVSCPESKLTLGQVCEVGCLFLVPLLQPHRRLKTLMLVGLAGWVVRAAALMSGDEDLVLALGVPMHGWSFAFFQVVGAVYLDREAPPHLRASAQGLLTFFTSGLGNLAGNYLAGRTVESATSAGGAVDWHAVWLVPLVGCSAALAAFALGFREPRGRD